MADAELVAVGTELLLGENVDTNSAWISERLAAIGVNVYRHTTVGDNVARMVEVIAGAAGRAEVVIVTGGLGPTQDDLTRSAVAQVAGVGLRRRPELAEAITAYFETRGRPMPASNLGQADLPIGARALAAVGTAPGFAVDVGAARVYCVPGVPREMQAMVERDIVPELQARFGLWATVSRVVRTSGLSESGVAEQVADLVTSLEEAGNPTIAFLASKGETRVRVTARAETPEAAAALAEPVVRGVLERLGAGVAGIDGEGVEDAIARQLVALGLTLATAESVTGGGVGARLVKVVGAGDWYRGGLITYATPVKATLAGVDEGLLDEHGPVSEPVARALAQGARERLDADVGLSVVGVAGPASQGGQSIGTAVLGFCGPDGRAVARTVRLPGRTRADLQEFAASAALDWARRRLATLA